MHTTHSLISMHELKLDLGQATWKPQYVGKATLTLPHYNFIPPWKAFKMKRWDQSTVNKRSRLLTIMIVKSTRSRGAMPNIMVQCILGIKIVSGLHLVVNEKAKDSKHKVHT